MLVGITKRLRPAKGSLGMVFGIRLTAKTAIFLIWVWIVYWASYYTIWLSIWAMVALVYYPFILPIKKIIEAKNKQTLPTNIKTPQIINKATQSQILTNDEVLQMSKSNIPLYKRWYVWVGGGAIFIIFLLFMIGVFGIVLQELEDQSQTAQTEPPYIETYAENDQQTEPITTAYEVITEPQMQEITTIEPHQEQATITQAQTTQPPTVATTTVVQPAITEPTTPTPTTQALQIISIPTEVRRNERVTISIQGLPNTQYKLEIRYATWATAEGLGDTTSDTNGFASWTWQIGGQTGARNDALARITGGGATIERIFSVIVD
ncbi:MAG: hypothetical protein FWE33_04565 [Defluviitaleaceae bacterium]|nr:hypothetical protein [Defluviitaleaceae bacterium]